jgi:omega-hydroxy-beta-dihydromenaquinone-9 sulfotransferase
VKPPIFVVGTGRSGTTIFFEMLSRHPAMAWHSLLLDQFVSRPGLNRLMFYLNRLILRSSSTPVLKDLTRRYFKPWEVWEYLRDIFPGFIEPNRDLLAGDATAREAREFHRLAASTLAGSRDQFLMKVTGWPRIGYLQAIFPEAKFIHVQRDGRPVVNSYLQMPWWWGWKGPQNWRYGLLSEEHRALWEKHDRSFVALGGIMWLIMMEAFDLAQSKAAPDSVLVVKYEDFCDNHIEAMEEVIQFCGYGPSQEFRSELNKFKVRSATQKWRNDLTEKQQKILDDIMAEPLKRYGY